MRRNRTTPSPGASAGPSGPIAPLPAATTAPHAAPCGGREQRPPEIERHRQAFVLDDRLFGGGPGTVEISGCGCEQGYPLGVIKGA